MPNTLKREDLDQFTGSFYYYKHYGLLLTDGAQHCAVHGCSWMMDVIWSYMGKIKVDSFSVARFKLDGKGGCTFTLDDGNGNVRATQAIEYTDLPFDLTLYVVQGHSGYVVMLPSEY